MGKLEEHEFLDESLYDDLDDSVFDDDLLPSEEDEGDLDPLLEDALEEIFSVIDEDEG
jgi:hypothetical protein